MKNKFLQASKICEIMLCSKSAHIPCWILTFAGRAGRLVANAPVVTGPASGSLFTVVGISIVGVLTVVNLAAMAAFYIRRKRKAKAQAQSNSSDLNSQSEAGDMGSRSSQVSSVDTDAISITSSSSSVAAAEIDLGRI